MIFVRLSRSLSDELSKKINCVRVERKFEIAIGDCLANFEVLLMIGYDNYQLYSFAYFIEKRNTVVLVIG